MRHTHNSNDLLSCLTDGAHAEILRRLCASQGAIAPLRMEYDTTSRPAGQGLETNRHCGWVVGRADLDVQRNSAIAQPAATWCGTELVYAAVQQAKH